jgi:CRP-like cAMP-binding protein
MDLMASDGFDFEGLVRAGYPLKRFEPGERIFVAGDDGSVMYAVRSGSVSIISAGEVLETVQPGATFGELSLIDGSPRGATAVAREDTEVAVIDEKAFNYLIERRPEFALDLMRRLSKRLRRMNENL